MSPAPATILTILGLSAMAPAQSASSTNHFLVATELASGAVGDSTTYRLHASLGSGVVPPRTASANFALTGGYVATLDAPHTGRPWLTGVLPRFATPRSGATLALHGTELDVGPAPTITVGGVAATQVTRAQDRIAARLGFQPEPGWQPVTVSNSQGASTVVEGIGILPMLMTEPAPAPNRRFALVFKGSPGDQVVWAMSPFTGPPLQIPGFLHGLALNPAALIMLPGFAISAPNGEFRLPIPATPYVGSVYVQAVFGTSNPGYGPVSFSNVLGF